MIIIPNISKGQLVPLQFAQDAVAASQTDAQLNVMEVAAGAALGIDGYVMPFNGDVVAITYKLSAAGTAGVFTIGVTVDGTEDTNTTQTVGTNAEASQTFSREKVRFTAGEEIGVEITTDGSWDGTTSDLLVTVWVLVHLDGV